MESILKNCKIEHIIDRTADGQATTTSTAVDMAGYDAAAFIIPIGASAANGVVTAKLQQSSDDGSTDGYSDIEGSSVTKTNGDNTELVIDIVKPGKRYLKCIVVTATGNSEIGPVLAVKYGSSFMPVTQGTNVSDSDLLVSPAEGTA
jgi:hypothetical protein